jgi:hypothetical protein
MDVVQITDLVVMSLWLVENGAVFVGHAGHVVREGVSVASLTEVMALQTGADWVAHRDSIHCVLSFHLV